MSSKCIYYVEGQCEQVLINALKVEPAHMIPGPVKVYNFIQERIPNSHLLKIHPGTIVALVFDTDKPDTKYLEQNIALLKKSCQKVKIIYLPQVLNFEEEIVKATDVREAEDLTHSSSVRHFKSDFCKLKLVDCRNLLNRHHFNIQKIWITKVPKDFSFIDSNSVIVKKL